MIELKARLAEAFRVNKSRRLSDHDKEAIRTLFRHHGIGTREEVARRLRRIRTQTGQRDHFIKALKRSHELIPEMENIFRDRGLPMALVRMPFIESAFNRKAISKHGAIGMWQFLPSTAKRFDPRGRWKDWVDPIRQTHSAAMLLKILRERLPDWGIAVTAYNSGALRLQRTVKRHRITKAAQLPDIPRGRGSLGFAGKNFYPELVAANLLEHYKEEVFPEVYGKIPKVYVANNIYLLEKEKNTKRVKTRQRRAGRRSKHTARRKRRR